MNQEKFYSGFVSVVGRPNVGKSTLINRLLGQKIAAVSPRPQTTQRNQLGILTDESTQLIFVDTPGMHKPLSKLGETMNDAAQESLKDTDEILWIVDVSQKPTAEDQLVSERIKASGGTDHAILVFNKVDLVNENQLKENSIFYQKLLPSVESISISSKTGHGCEQLLKWMKEHLPEGPAFYESDQITDLYEREIAADLIRESLLKNLNDEIPHSIAVRIDEYADRTETTSYIQATLLCDKDSHKAIVIGKNGTMIKKIGLDARKEIEKLTDRRVYLELRVKVLKNWKNNTELLRSLGLCKTE